MKREIARKKIIPLRFTLFLFVIIPISALTADGNFSKKAYTAQSYVPESSETKKLNINYMLAGYLYALNQNDHPGWSRKGALAPEIFPSFYKPKKNSIELVAFPKQKSIFQGTYEGFKLVLANPTDKVVEIDVQDSQLPIVMQAKIEGKDWKKIEYLGRSTCGNSYSTVTLPSNEALVLTAPIYHGDLKAKLRFSFGDITSNTFEGRINKEQFTSKLFTESELNKNMGVLTTDMLDKQFKN